MLDMFCLVVSNMVFSISYMGCHPKPIDELHHFSEVVISRCESNLAGFPSNDPLWITDLPRKTWWPSWGKVTNQADQETLCAIFVVGLQRMRSSTCFFSSDLGDISIEIPLKNSQPGDLCREQRLSALVLTGKKSHGACGRFHRYYYGILWRKKKNYKIYCWSWWAELVETTSKHQPITINNPRCF